MQLLDLFFVHFSVRDFMNGVLDNDLKEPQGGFVYLWHACSLFYVCSPAYVCSNVFMILKRTIMMLLLISS